MLSEVVVVRLLLEFNSLSIRNTCFFFRYIRPCNLNSSGFFCLTRRLEISSVALKNKIHHEICTQLCSFSLSQNLTGCKCIAHADGPGTASPGKCPSPGCQQAFLTFLAVVCVCSMIGAMAQTPSVIILIR